MWLNALSIPYTLSSLMYNGWAKDSWLQPITTFRITLILTGVITTYLVIVYIRATISYKKKRGNQRIFEEPRKEHKKRWKKRTEDRKSTRLNSSHVSISYAVFCLKKKIN